MTGYLLQAVIYLCAAVISVPIAKRLGLGSVLGYLIAGVIIGPLTGLVGAETDTIQHFAEFGVVMMLFLVGLELNPQSLWQMRHRLIGLGGLQVTVTAAAVMAVALAFGQPWQTALAIGLVFALSSTAIVLQTFQEKGLGKTDGGQSAFSVLLFQDIAVIPMLALMPLLALPELAGVAEVAHGDHGHELSLVAGLPTWAYTLVVLGSVAAVVLVGHFLSRPAFRFIAETGLREIFVATALLLVLAIASLMSLVGLSPALGTFLAGVVLANSEFRHELEANIEPFKGLLLGLFFITVGAGLDFGVIASNWQPIFGLTALLLTIKAAVLYGLGTIFKVRDSNRWLFALSLAQAGEFGFVLLNFTVQNSVIPAQTAAILQPIVAISMFLTPVLFIIFDRVILPRYQQQVNEREPDRIEEQGTVIIAGVGRFGQIINRLLVANGIQTVVLDSRATQVDRMRMINIKTFYGDATRPDLLHTAGIDNAALVVVAIDDREASTAMVKELKHAHPKLKVLARAYDRAHGYELRSAGADFIQSETYLSALEVGAEALRSLGLHPFRVQQKRNTFLHEDRATADTLYREWQKGQEKDGNYDGFRDIFIQTDRAIMEAMQADRMSSHHNSGERQWTPPPSNYVARD